MLTSLLMISNCTLLLSRGTTLSPLQLIWADLPRPGLKNLPTFLSTLRLLRPPLLPLRPLMTGPPLPRSMLCSSEMDCSGTRKVLSIETLPSHCPRSKSPTPMSQAGTC
uniref:Uncharacterized protein n=1 Tax=Cacopsylla melanoneura TaxID=428564 RepID=A0A8D8LK54_9HEMI